MLGCWCRPSASSCCSLPVWSRMLGETAVCLPSGDASWVLPFNKQLLFFANTWRLSGHVFRLGLAF